MHCPKMLVRTLFVFILLAGLLAGIFLSSLASVRAANLTDIPVCGLPMAKWTFDPTPVSITSPVTNSSNVIASALENGVGDIGFTTTGSHTDNAWSGSGWSTTSSPNTTYFEFDVSSVGYTGIAISLFLSSSS